MDDGQDTAWRDALQVTPGRLAGVRVRPLSAWHMHALTMLGVKVTVDAEGHGPTRGDMLLALPILRSRWTITREGLPKPSGLLKRWLKYRWLFVPWQTDARALVRFVAAYNRHPAIDPPKDAKAPKAEPFGCPPHFALAVDLAQRLPSLPLADAFNMPLCQLHLMRAASLELAGDLKCSWSGAAEAEKNATLAALTDPALLAEVDRMNREAKERHAKAQAG